MSIRRGFNVYNHFWQNPQLREMSPSHRGMLADIFSMLASETRKTWWGFLANHDGKPISERALRAELGKNPIAASSWHRAREDFLEKGILKKLSILGCAYLYCPVFVEMNPFDGIRKTKIIVDEKTALKPKLLKAELYLGYDPDDERQDNELDIWGRVCRLWLELSEGKPPMSSETSLSVKNEMKSDIIKMIDEIGIDNALHDMEIAFEFKKRAGGRINSIEYIMARWRSKDWIKRFDSNCGFNKSQKNYINLRRDVQRLIDNGTVNNLDELFYYLPLNDRDMLLKIAKGFKLK